MAVVVRYYRRWQKQKRGVDKPHSASCFFPAATAGSMHACTQSGDLFILRQSTLSLLRESTLGIQQGQSILAACLLDASL